MEQESASTPRLLRLVRRPLGSVSEGLTPVRKRFVTTQRELREDESEKLRAEVLGLKKQIAEMQQKYEGELQRLQTHMKDLKDRSNFAEPIASVVRSSISSFTVLHKELQLELGDFHVKTVRRIRGREADIFNLFATRVKQLESELTAEREKNKGRGNSKDDPWIVVKRLEGTLREGEEFHSQLLADNKALKEKCKEYQTTNEVRTIENEKIMQENARLKRQIEEHKVALPPSTRDIGTQDSLESSTSTNALICLVDALKSKLAVCQKELRSASQELQRHRSQRTDTEELLTRCIEDIRSQAQSMESYSGRLRGVLTPKDRQQLLQRLLLEEQALEILRVNAFPVGTLRAYLTGGSPMQARGTEWNTDQLATESHSYRSRSVVRLPR